MAEAAVEPSNENVKVEEKQPNKSLCEEAFHNFLAGKRHILVKDFSHAVQSLAKACELYTEHYGEMAPECGDVYFLYGKALFQLFQQQAGIFGDTVPEGSSNDDEEEEEDADSDEEKEKGSNEEDDKGEEENEENEDAKEDDSESVTSSKDEEKADSMDGVKSASEPVVKDDGDATVSSTVDESSSKPDAIPMEQTEESKPDPEPVEAGPSTSKSKQPKSEDEISDLQLAWENLEIARSIFQKQGPDAKEAQLKVAELLLILGEISLECDSYEAAIKDLKACLEIWLRYLSADDRRIAETYYQLGLAHQLSDQSPKALDYFQSTIDVIQLRIGNLKNQTVIEQNADGFDIDPNIEIQELETLLPDIKAKMDDAKDLDKETKKAIEELALQKMEEVQVNSTSEEKPVKNINHLLKRKKPDDQDNSKTEDVKKIKLSSPTSSTEEQNQSSSEAAPASKT